jgi:hypothetical protein
MSRTVQIITKLGVENKSLSVDFGGCVMGDIVD